jgi:hypothetical protein
MVGVSNCVRSETTAIISHEGGFMNTLCGDSEHCFYQDLRGDKLKYCRILTTKEGKEPYKDGMCPFFKRRASDKSGGRNDERKDS